MLAAVTESTISIATSTPSSVFLFEFDMSAILWAWYAFLVVFYCWGNIDDRSPGVRAKKDSAR